MVNAGIHERRSPRLLPSLLATLILLCFGQITGLSAASIFRPSPAQLNPAEKFVLDQVAAGKSANLKEFSQDDTNRVLRAGFLESLLTNGRKDFTVHRNGVLIESARVLEPMDLRNAEIQHDTRLAQCRFEGEVNFSKSVFENSFSVEGSTFNKTANFSTMKVGRGAFFDQAIFEGPLDLGQADISGVFTANEARFQSETGPINFSSMKTGGNAFFSKAIFAGPVTFQYSHIADNFKVDTSQFLNRSNLVNFEGMKVGGTASFLAATFAGYVSFKDASFVTLDLSNAQWPTNISHPWFWLNGMTYQRICAGSEKESWRNLLHLVDRTARRSAYSKDVYASLEEFYRRQGYPRQANMFFIAQKQREREEILRGPDWCWNLFLDWFIGYGRSPVRAFLWSTAIILMGCVVFRPDRMEAQKAEFQHYKYSRFWYSLDLYLPVIKLYDAEVWKPKEECWFAHCWRKVHTILGWALIPIALAAWTGMLSH